MEQAKKIVLFGVWGLANRSHPASNDRGPDSAAAIPGWSFARSATPELKYNQRRRLPPCLRAAPIPTADVEANRGSLR